jgi:signal transduction histidine kinase
MFLSFSLAFLLTIAATTPAATQGNSRPPSILILNQSGLPGYQEISNDVRSTLKTITKSPVAVYEENLDLNHFGGDSYNALVLGHIRQKYTNKPIDILVANGAQALMLALQARVESWTSIPIVFAGVDEASIAGTEKSLNSSNVTGALIRLLFRNSVAAAVTLIPDLKTIVVIGDPFERQPFRRKYKDQLTDLPAGLTLVDLQGVALDEVARRVSALTENTAIVYTTITSDGAGAPILPNEALVTIAKSANRPILVDVENRLGHGTVGGFVARSSLVGEGAAHTVARILSGTEARDIPIETSDVVKPIFDWRELQRWKIDESVLPPNSEIRYREFSLWTRYRWWLLLVMAAVALQSALVIGLIYEDIRRRKAEAHERALLAQLGHLNRVATAGELTASIAHEIRQPLAAIVVCGSAALNWLKNKTPDLDEIRTNLQNIVNEGHRAGEVIQNIRATFRKEEAPHQEIDANEVTKQVLALVARKIETEDITLETEYSEDRPIVVANPVQLQQLFLNLIINAIEAMSDPACVNRVLTVRTLVEQDNCVVIKVEDTGPGIGRTRSEDIFKPFFTTKPNGMGLGLSICQSIVESHGGHLTAISDAKHGSIFRIDLPKYGSSAHGK